tara:strand:- start:613 stop:1464 length:852 start_codon:yes stop_codon:yes gene_type:complete
VSTPLRITGIGLRTPHISEFLEKKPGVAWVEVHSENYFGEGGRPLHQLEQVRKDYPISLHGVSLSLGSTDDLNWQHLTDLRNLSQQVDASLISDHLSWSSFNGQYFHDLLPLPYTDESLAHMVSRIQQVQDFLGRQILIENISSYITYQHSTIPEWEFIRSMAEQSGCGILLDVNNVYVNATNHDFNPLTYLNAIPEKLVHEIHLAGFATTIIDKQEILIDSHNQRIVPAVWDLLRTAIHQYGIKPVMIEWDNDLPSLDKLCLEAWRAESIIKENYVAAKRTG